MSYGDMSYEEKLKKVCNDFSLLSEEQQNYIIGIMDALHFAESVHNESMSENRRKHDS